MIDLNAAMQPPPDLPRLRCLAAAVLAATVSLSAVSSLPAAAQAGSDEPKPALILRDGCCFIPPSSPLAIETAPAAPQPALTQADAAPPQPPGAPSQMSAPPPSVPATGTADVSPAIAIPWNSEIDNAPMDERSRVIDTLKGVLDGRPRFELQTPAESLPNPSPAPPVAPLQAAALDPQLNRLINSLPWRILEGLSLVFALGIAVAAAYLAHRRGSDAVD